MSNQKNSDVLGKTVTDQKQDPKSPAQRDKPHFSETQMTEHKAAVVSPKSQAIRDTFSMPASDHQLIEQLRITAAREGRITNKSEVIRAGLQSLAGLNPGQLVVMLNGLEKIRPGRK